MLKSKHKTKEKRMQTLNLKIDDTFFPHFKAILDSFIKDKKIEIIDNTPHDFMVNSVEEVKKRVFEADQETSLSQDEYNEKIESFFNNELGITR